MSAISTRSVRMPMAFRSMISARMLSNKVPAYPYCGNPDGFKQIDANSVKVTPAPKNMPRVTFPNGDSMPMIGMGTFTGTRHTAKAQGGTMYETVKMWIRAGGRAIDAASNYLNEDEIGDAIADCIADGIVTREELFVSSKLNNPYHREEHVRPMLEKTLLDLRLDYVDMYLMHWPTAFKYVPYDQNKRGFPPEYEPDCCTAVTGVKWDPEKFQANWPAPHLDMGVTIHETWGAMEKCADAGLTRNIGVCNMKVTLLHELACGGGRTPAVAQSECHPYNQQELLIKYCEMNNIRFQAYSPLGYGEFKSKDEVTVLENDVLRTIAEKHSKTVAEVVLRWHVQRGVATPPFSLKEHELRMNLTVGDWELPQEDMETIKSIDKNHHYLRPESWYGLPLWS